MSELLEKQKQFGRMVPRLLDYIDSCGYDYTLGWIYRDSKSCHELGFDDSLHGDKMAIDIAIFKKSAPDTYLTDTHEYLFAGEYWERLGGAWGGRFSKPDGNHFSLSYRGRK